MKKRSLWLITALMTIALLGVFVMQLYYIREAYNLKSQLFEQDVTQALNAVVNKVQKRYAASHLNKKDDQLREEREAELRDKAQILVEFKEKHKEREELRKLEQQKKIIADLNMQDSVIRNNYLRPMIITEKEFTSMSTLDDDKKSPLQVDMNFGVDKAGNVITANINQTYIPIPEKVVTFKVTTDRLPDSIRYLAFNPFSKKPLLITLPRVSPEMAAKFKSEDEIEAQKFQRAFKELLTDTVIIKTNSLNYLEDVAKEMRQDNIPINERVPRDILDTLIRNELLNRNIKLDYNFWVKLANKDSVLYRRVSSADVEPVPADVHKVALFSNDIFRDPGMLYLNFPNENSLILGNLSATMGSSAGLLLVLVFIFAYTIYAILKQKKISEMKTDFINNMTHEFKTPVATIMIASEALKDPEITSDKSRVKRLAGIIYDENVRLGNHIERVLSIARLEKKELKLERTELNVNDLILVVVDSMNLQLQKNNAAVKLHLDATQDLIYADELHLSNVIYNLIDNANKYSANAPQITLSTKNTGKGLVIEVADEGIGMTKEQTKRVFDQFYRVPTGNLHDVKGFGLGLNYVQDIIEQMNGVIKVHSEKDKGTVFEIILPLNHN
ncbi:two-component sensor histidine kinase [Pedobacter sp. KBW06]|uniref:sensor histidine kinase n=1 Tax=Pedobacter sp. KBW06 TaxID=2153359 RepID=UPI000F59DE08|nr:HAMP domain-containing sensor histidine kinase [Pedobacter sp. KBW06]RQO72387.1 two-component sensor histidine kinase [Pedobacter sp. KBW06]